MSSILSLFWDLAAPAADARLAASTRLLQALQAFQAAHALPTPHSSAAPSIASDDSASESGIEVSDDDDDEEQEDHDEQTEGSDDRRTLRRTERTLARTLAPDVLYALKRLLRGLASARQSARLGFSVALTQLLQEIGPLLTPDQVLILLAAHTKPPPGPSRQDTKDHLFATLFGLHAIVSSRLLFAHPSTSISLSPSDPLVAFQSIVSQLGQIAEQKSWLAEAASATTLDLLRQLTSVAVGKAPAWTSEALQSFIHQTYIDSSHWTLEKVAYTLFLQSCPLPSIDEEAWHRYLSPVFKHPQLLASENLPTLSRIFRALSADPFSTTATNPAKVTQDQDRAKDKDQSGAWKPQLHYVWHQVLDVYFPVAEESTQARARVDVAGKAPFSEFWNVIVEHGMFAPAASAERKSHGFLFAQAALQRLPPADLTLILTPQFMRTWMNHLRSQDRVLNRASVAFAKAIQGRAQADQSVALTLVSHLLGVHGAPDFDRVTGSKTISTILAALDASGVSEFVDSLQKLFVEDETRRLWVIQQHLVLLRSGNMPRADAWMQKALFFLFNLALFGQFGSIKVTSTLQETCKSHVITALADLGKPSLQKVDGKVQKLPAFTSVGKKTWFEILYEHFVQASKDGSQVMTDKQSLDKLEQQLRKISDVKPQDPLLEAQRTLAYALWLCSKLDSFDLTAELTEVLTVYDNFRSSSSDEKEQSVTQVIDLLLTLLSRRSALLRNVTNHVFTCMTSFVNKTALDLILKQIADEDAVDADHEDQSLATSEQSSSDDEESDDAASSEGDGDVIMDVDDELRSKIAEALEVSKDDEESDESLSEADDEEMLAMDDKLASIFQQRQLMTGKNRHKLEAREAAHDQSRVLDLVEIYAKSRPQDPLMLRLMIPLISLILSAPRNAHSVADKGTAILRSRFIQAKEVPSGCVRDQVVNVMTEVHGAAKKSSSHEFVNICSGCSIYCCKVLKECAPDHFADDIAAIYKDSFDHYLTQKNSGLHINMFADLAKRYPDVVWNFRSKITDAPSKFTYRKIQSLSLLQTLLSHAGKSHAEIPYAQDDIFAFIIDIRMNIYSLLSSACEASSGYNTARVKEVLKLSLNLVRTSRTIVGSEANRLTSLWDASNFDDLTLSLTQAKHLKGGNSLVNLCHQQQKLLSGATQTAQKASAHAEPKKDAAQKDTVKKNTGKSVNKSKKRPRTE